MKRAIEDSFQIVEINRLAVPESNSFKPIYQVHKWFPAGVLRVPGHPAWCAEAAARRQGRQAT